MQNHEIFDLENAIICTDFDRARKIINSIRNNNSSVPPLVSWILSKVISSCYGIKSSKGKPNLYDLGIWRDVQSEYMSFSNKIALIKLIRSQMLFYLINLPKEYIQLTRGMY